MTGLELSAPSDYPLATVPTGKSPAGGGWPRTGRLPALAAAFLLSMTALPGPSDAQSSGNPKTAVQGFYDTLLDTMQNAHSLGERGRYVKLEPAVGHVFDVSDMTRLAVGAAWNSLSEDQRRRTIAAFGRYITATYANRFDGYSAEKFRVTGERSSAYGTFVETEIVRSKGDPVNVTYLMRQNQGAWQIEDVYLTGTISEVATRRSEFGSILRRDGVEALIGLLNRKADTMGGTAS